MSELERLSFTIEKSLLQRMEKLMAKKGKLKWNTPLGPKSMPAEALLELLSENLS